MSKNPVLAMRDSVQRFASRTRSARTAKTYGAIAESFLVFLGGGAPTASDVERFLAQPLKSGGRAAVSTYNQKLAALRSYAHFAMKVGLWLSDPTADLPFERVISQEPSVLFLPEVRQFIGAVPLVSAAREVARDLAITAIGFTLGLRVSELAGLDRPEVDVQTGTLVRVVRKGGRVQALPLGPKTLQLVRAWDEQRDSMARPDERALFVSDRGTRISVRTIQRLYQRVRAYLRIAKRVTPHTARHSFITNECERAPRSADSR